MENPKLIQQLEQQLRFAKRKQDAQAAVLIAITQEEDPKVLLTRRALNMNSHAGEVAFPGGKRDPTDTSDIAAALREAWEETALNPFDVKVVGDLPMEKVRNGLTVKPIVGIIPAEIQLVPQPTEIDRIFFASLQQLMVTQPEPHKVQYAQQSLYFPSFQIENEVIWGLTARILISLFQYGFNVQKSWPMLIDATTIETAQIDATQINLLPK